MINIRRATAKDVNAIWTVRTEAINSINESFYPKSEINAWASNPQPINFEEVLNQLDWYIAEYDTLIVGSGFLDRSNGEIGGIFVSPKFQRKKIGLQILRRLEKVAIDNKVKTLHLSATLNAEAFYRAAGYHSVKKGKYCHVSGLDFNCVIMEKVI